VLSRCEFFMLLCAAEAGWDWVGWESADFEDGVPITTRVRSPRLSDDWVAGKSFAFFGRWMDSFGWFARYVEKGPWAAERSRSRSDRGGGRQALDTKPYMDAGWSGRCSYSRRHIRFARRTKGGLQVAVVRKSEEETLDQKEVQSSSKSGSLNLNWPQRSILTYIR